MPGFTLTVRHRQPMTGSNSPGAFERSIAAFSHCREAGVLCGVRITLTKENFSEPDILVELAKLLVQAVSACTDWCQQGGEWTHMTN